MVSSYRQQNFSTCFGPHFPSLRDIHIVSVSRGLVNESDSADERNHITGMVSKFPSLVAYAPPSFPSSSAIENIQDPS